MKRTPYGGVHAGFYNSMKQIGDPLLELIYPGLLSGSKVVVTGHSRGGALAILFVFLLALNEFRVAGCYTFGSPKIGDAEFANHWRKEAERLPVRNSWIPQFVLFPIRVIMFPIYLIVSLLWLLWIIAVVPTFFRTRRFFSLLLKGKLRDERVQSYSPFRLHPMEVYLKSITADVKWRTDICMLYFNIIENVLATAKGSSANFESARAEYRSMTNYAEQVVAGPDAIERFCNRFGLITGPIGEWINDYRDFLQTRKIRREEQFFNEVSGLRNQNISSSATDKDA